MTLPVRKDLLAKIATGNNGVVTRHYPYTYALSFLSAYPEVIPSAIKEPTGSKVYAPAAQGNLILGMWAESINVTKDELANHLADIWIDLHHSGS